MSDKNLEDLARAAQIKLKAQNKSQEKDTNPVEDIYAEFREEDNIPSISKAPVLKNQDINLQESYEEDIDNPIDENDYQLYENGPYKSQVDIWKKQYGNGKVLHTQILEKHFIFRTLNRYEYKQLIALENVDALMREEIICTTCVLHPKNYNFKVMATQESGYPSTLAQIISESSGFTREYAIEIL